MKLIIAAAPGERRFSALVHAIGAFNIKADDVTVVVSDGTHPLAAMWAGMIGKPLRRFECNPQIYGFAASKTRNIQMCSFAEALLILTPSKPGSLAHLLQTAERMGLRVMAHPVGS